VLLKLLLQKIVNFPNRFDRIECDPHFRQDYQPCNYDQVPAPPGLHPGPTPVAVSAELPPITVIVQPPEPTPAAASPEAPPQVKVVVPPPGVSPKTM